MPGFLSRMYARKHFKETVESSQAYMYAEEMKERKKVAPFNYHPAFLGPAVFDSSFLLVLVRFFPNIRFRFSLVLVFSVKTVGFGKQP